MNNCVPRNTNYCGEQSHHHHQQQKQFISKTTTNKGTRSSSSTTIIAVVLLSLFGFWIFLWTLMLAVRSVFVKLVQKRHQIPSYSEEQTKGLFEDRKFQKQTTSTQTTM